MSRPRIIHFGSYIVTPHVFHTSPHSFALVNIKPLLPGHVLVSPLRVVPRLSDLSQEEVADLFQTVQRVGRMLTRVFASDALNVAVQDGAAAGQSVPHSKVHAHIIPRHDQDLDSKGGSDAIYDMMEGEEGNVGRHFHERRSGKFAKPDVDDERAARSDEELKKEATWFAEEMEKGT